MGALFGGQPSAPKAPDPKPAPPEARKTADEVKSAGTAKELTDDEKKKSTDMSLRIKRDTLGTGTSGSGLNI
jgi:hypothetical protein